MNTLMIAWAIAQLATVPVSDDLDAVRWLSGCWESRRGSRVVTEVWGPPSGGVMVGTSVTSVDGRASAFEYLRIEAGSGGGIVYIAVPSEQRETSFRSTRVGENGFLVENPEHDFPTRIRYTTTGRTASRLA